MKFTLTLFLAPLVSPFTTNPLTSRVNTLRAVDEVSSTTVEVAPPPPSLMQSPSLPWMKVSSVLDGSMAGDVGFDPLGFATNMKDLNNYREAEIKHGRLAMLAAAGWPISELLDEKFASILHLPTTLDINDRVPSLLNGGLGKVSPIFWGFCLGLTAAIDLYGIQRQKNIHNTNYIPGDLGFDPIGLYPLEASARKEMQVKEIKNGRLAMIAITLFALEEFLGHSGVVDASSFFFEPVWKSIPEGMDSMTNSGYIK